MTTIEKPRTTTDSARGEVVTQALTRLLKVPSAAAPGGSITVALITLDNGRDHTRPNTLGPLGLASLDAAISTAIEAAPDAIAVTGKPFIFAAGADLSQVGAIRQPADGGRLRRARSSGVRTAPRIAGADLRVRRTVSPSAAGWNWPCIATTGRLPPTPPAFPSRRCSSASCPAGVAPS